ncbi:MAG TPA: trehalose-phosphatase [Nitrospira sp.]|nr:trehalose-phosphatase [Nitrospira sp.]
MIHALSDAGLSALRTATSQPLLYAFDFDGTLAPISPDRQAVRISTGVLHCLGELAKRAPCAIVSGRALADVEGRINGYVQYVLGNHGIESPLTAQSRLLDAERTCADWKHQLQRSLDSLGLPGVEIEDKRYTLTIHFRRAANPATAGAHALIPLRQLTPTPELIEGKYSINVLPPGQGGKGPAAFALMNHLGRRGLFYIGDEQTDETVFALSNVVTMGVRVGKQDGSRAAYYLNDQTEVEELLRRLIECMGPSWSNPA